MEELLRVENFGHIYATLGAYYLACVAIPLFRDFMGFERFSEIRNSIIKDTRMYKFLISKTTFTIASKSKIGGYITNVLNKLKDDTRAISNQHSDIYLKPIYTYFGLNCFTTLLIGGLGNNCGYSKLMALNCVSGVVFGIGILLVLQNNAETKTRPISIAVGFYLLSLLLISYTPNNQIDRISCFTYNHIQYVDRIIIWNLVLSFSPLVLHTFSELFMILRAYYYSILLLIIRYQLALQVFDDLTDEGNEEPPILMGAQQTPDGK